MSLTDSFGRKHDYLRISLTEKCNLRCVYCMPAEGIALKPRAAYMQQDELLSIASEFVKLGVRKIRITGGEPLVRKDAAEIIRGLAGLGVSVGITTNGILVDQYIDVFRESGISTVNVSVDTLRHERMNTITRRDHFEKIMSNIGLLTGNGFRVKLNAVIIRGMNDDELIDFVKFTEKHPVEFRFIEFMPFAGNKWDLSRCVSYKEITGKVQEVYGESMSRLIDGQNDTARHFRIEGHAGTFAIISSVTNPFCDTCNRLRVTADGKMRNCLFSSGETDLLGALRSGQALEPLIRETVMHKKAVRAGMNTTDDVKPGIENGNLRSMISIGG